ncbi:type I glyceraldehyde-3-phosphate dehydrogenase [Pseudaminobacter sp. NGMCC 1.201702]|uniref:type I glyceraldehyde-3-phosphate dehydrogenase n=1 Tax=Pseudaminobacter sp. NGMCC 1.201702 TaxID=3391825 RepID=UPI0039EFE3EF
MKIAINGFGRIGRSILRLALRSDDVEVTLINDVAPLETCGYLFEYDSIFGPWQGQVTTGNDRLTINGREIPFHRQRDLAALDLSGVDVFLECTGQPDPVGRAQCGLRRGAQRALISGSATNADVTLVLGANEGRYRGESIVSNASCTTNALAPILRILDKEFGVISGQMTTVHCYTGSQPTVDQPREDLVRSRAAALSMVPTTTSAHRLLGDVLPNLAGRIEARALRVPTASVSAIDLTVEVQHRTDVDSARRIIKAAVETCPVLAWIDKPLVSVDLRGRPESLIVSGPELSITASGGLLRIFGWYDNEWGFASRMLDMARLLSRHELEEWS